MHAEKESGYYRKLGGPECLHWMFFYLRLVNIDTKVLGTLLFIVVCLTRRNERHLVIFKKSSPGDVKKRVII